MRARFVTSGAGATGAAAAVIAIAAAAAIGAAAQGLPSTSSTDRGFTAASSSSVSSSDFTIPSTSTDSLATSPSSTGTTTATGVGGVTTTAATTSLDLTATPTATTVPYLNSSGLPPAGTFALGAWINWSEYPQYGLDTPAAFNARLGYNAASFQVRQSIPPQVDSAGNNVTVDVAGTFDDSTDASVFFTVYADQYCGDLSGLSCIGQYEYDSLALQLANVTATTGRAVLLRYCPEMNGDWMLYGVQATAFIASWIQMATSMRTYAPDVKLVWSPNFDLESRGDNSGTAQTYWPGTQYVDWVGTSQYWKPSQESIDTGSAFTGNFAPDSSYFTDSINYVYQTYAEGYGKPFVISEASAAWETENGTTLADQITHPGLQY
ncbi:hypothetical protein HK405_010640, partial [Cladochytrium tenue]